MKKIVSLLLVLLLALTSAVAVNAEGIKDIFGSDTSRGTYTVIDDNHGVTVDVIDYTNKLYPSVYRSDDADDINGELSYALGNNGFPMALDSSLYPMAVNTEKLWDVSAADDLEINCFKDSNVGSFLIYDSDTNRYHIDSWNSQGTAQRLMYDTTTHKFSYEDYYCDADATVSTQGNMKNFLTDSFGFYFALSLRVDFVMPANGNLVYTDGNNVSHTDPMKYEFAGDDLILVYIDGVRVLNGSIQWWAMPYSGQDPHGPSIDFSTGEVYTMTGKNSITQTTLYDQFELYCEDMGMTQAQTSAFLSSKFDYVDGNYILKTGHHNFAMFYAETAGGSSNCRLNFNLLANNDNIERFVDSSVFYDPNGGAFSDSTTTPKFDAIYAENDTVTVKGTNSDGFLPTRTGYTFTGWNTAAAGSGTARAVGGTFSMPGENVTLYAQWTLDNTLLPDPPYILYYDRDTLLKKIKITDSSATHTITADPIATGAESGVTGIVDGLPTREGWLFAGWYTSAPAAAGRTAGDAYPRSFTISTYQSSASDNVELYAGWVPVSDVTKDAADDKNYGTNTLGGFSMQGVQVRSPELAETYQPGNKNTVNPGIRFVTVYNKTMLNQLGSLKPQAFTREDGDIPVYESGAVRYGYVLSANLSGLSTSNQLKWNSTGAIQTDCTKDDHNRDHRNFGSYILSTTVIKFDESGDITNYGSRLFEARAFVTYTDCNGYQRVRYSTYSTSKFAGGCRTCYNDANAWAQLHRV